MHCDFLGSDGLQETHMDAFKSFNSKLVTLTMRGGFFTKFSALAHGLPRHPLILADQLILSQPGGADYAHHITLGNPRFSDLPTALKSARAEGNLPDFL